MTTTSTPAPFTTSLSEMATVQHILDSDATHEEYLSGLTEAATDLNLAITGPDQELDEDTADHLLAYFRTAYMGDED